MNPSALLPRPRRLATRLVVPFFVLVVFLAAVGTWYFTRQAVGSLQERRLAQLADALRREQVVLDHAQDASLDLVRRVAATTAIADALAAGDVASAATATARAADDAGGSVSHAGLVVAGAAGPEVVVDLRRLPDPAGDATGRTESPGHGLSFAADPSSTAPFGAQLRGFGGLGRVLQGSPGGVDDKDAALVTATESLPAALVVAGPLRRVDEDGRESVVGAVVVATPLADLVEAARAELGIDSAIATADGAVLASTFGGGGGGPFEWAREIDDASEGQRSLARSVSWNGGEYTVATSGLRLRGSAAGFIAAALPDAPVAKSVTATRVQVLGLFAGGLAGVLLVGFWVSRRLARDIDELAGAADAVAGGDFDRRVAERSRDELGRLSAGFNVMAARLAEYRAEQEDVIRALREADRAKDEFIDNLSHELRTPLTPIKGSARLLARDDLDAQTRKQMADLISANSDRLLEQANRLIAMSSRAQRGAPEPEPVDLEALAAQVVHTRVARDRRERIRIEKARSAPPLAYAESWAVAQIFYDLVDNALKFSDGLVEVAFVAGPDWAGVEVSDRGPGIPDDERARVFERFYQVDGSSTREHGGLGLGLAVAADLSRWLGGAVTVSGRPGGGTVAVFHLPRDPAGAEADSENVGLFGLAVKGVPAQSR